jgi:hypothetical protein
MRPLKEVLGRALSGFQGARFSRSVGRDNRPRTLA